MDALDVSDNSLALTGPDAISTMRARESNLPVSRRAVAQRADLAGQYAG